MPDQVDEQVKAFRSERLIALGEENRLAFEESWMGREAEILFEEKNTIAGKEYFTGYTKEYIRAAVLADRDYANGNSAWDSDRGTGGTYLYAERINFW